MLALKNHFEEVGATMSKEWAERAGSRGAGCFICLQIINLIKLKKKAV